MRYYERRRLLPRATRTRGGFRLFGPEAVESILFIKQAQSLWFTPNEAAQLLTGGGRARQSAVACPVFVGMTQIEPLTRGNKEGRK